MLRQSAQRVARGQVFTTAGRLQPKTERLHCTGGHFQDRLLNPFRRLRIIRRQLRQQGGQLIRRPLRTGTGTAQAEQQKSSCNK